MKANWRKGISGPLLHPFILGDVLGAGVYALVALVAVLGRVWLQRRTPWVAILGTTLIAMSLTLIGDLATLAKTVVLL